MAEISYSWVWDLLCLGAVYSLSADLSGLMNAMSNLQVTVLVDDQHRDRILEVVEALQTSGMTVERWMEQIGVITGSVDSTQVDRLSQVEGVAAVEQSHSYQLEPPNSDIQ